MKKVILLFSLFFCTKVFCENLHLIDTNDSNGFALFRSGKPNEEDMKTFCKLGIEEIMVLSGDANKHEFKYHEACPSLKVIFNTTQDPRKPLSRSFLESFDRWVEQAQAQGKKIAFRCSCGCHRTGRLAAYYQMKYQNLTVDDAQAIMNKHGKFMAFEKQLIPQTQALFDFIKGRECSVPSKHCVMDN